jgi:hypothetical protein
MLAVATIAPASVVTAFNANVNEWSSSTVSDPMHGIYPIGGSGAINGGFVVATSSLTNGGDQIGLRASLRFSGLLPQINDGVFTATYFAPAGSSGGNLALWNIDGDIDLRQSGHTIGDYTATLTFTDRSGLVTPVDAVMSGLAPANTRLGQASDNPGFSFLSPVFPSFDPNAPGVYSLDLTLVPKTFSGDTLEARINVDVAAVPEPTTLALALSGGVGLILLRGRKTAR